MIRYIKIASTIPAANAQLAALLEEYQFVMPVRVGVTAPIKHGQFTTSYEHHWHYAVCDADEGKQTVIQKIVNLFSTNTDIHQRV